MSGPDAGGAYVRQKDSTLTRVERTIGPNETPEPQAADAPPPAPKAPASTPKEKS